MKDKISVQLTGNFGSGWFEKQLMHFLRVAESFRRSKFSTHCGDNWVGHI